MSFLNVFNDSLASTGSLSSDDLRMEVITEVIDVINHEFAPSVLQHPSETERRRVTERIASLVTTAMRRRNTSPGFAYESELAGELARRLMGLGFLDLLLPPARTDLSEITVYSSGLIQVMLKGHIRWQTVDMQPSAEEIERVLDRLLGPQNKSLNETNPSINAKLPRTADNPGGGRVKALHKAIVPPSRNHSVNIRLYEQKPVLPEWLIERQSLSAEMMDTLREAMESGKRILISGGTRTGKTTMLSAICNFLPYGWRIVKIEDPEEIWIDRPTVQSVEVRPQAIGTEVKPYTLADGVDDAMRMSPDYLIIGEVRDGKAAQALFRAMMTGHSGACTFHADSPEEAANRLANIMGSDTGVNDLVAKQMIANSIDVLVQINIRHEKRCVVNISKVPGNLDGPDVVFETIWQYDEDSPAGNPRWNHLTELK